MAVSGHLRCDALYFGEQLCRLRGRKTDIPMSREPQVERDHLKPETQVAVICKRFPGGHVVVNAKALGDQRPVTFGDNYIGRARDLRELGLELGCRAPGTRGRGDLELQPTVPQLDQFKLARPLPGEPGE